MKSNNKMLHILPRLAGLAAACAALPAAALDFNAGGMDFQLNNAFSVATAMRVNQRAGYLVGLGNGGQSYSTNDDDGNLAYDKRKFVSGSTRLTSDFSAKYGDFGLFVRGTGIFDPKFEQRADSLFDPADYGAGKEQPQSERDYKTTAVEKEVGRKAEVLDAYMYGAIPLGDHSLTLRLGRQTINWGESTFVLNGVNSSVALNANKARIPGFDLAEVLRPAGALWGSMDWWGGVVTEGFYQYEWRPTVIDASGTYWSTNDFAGIGGTQANIGFGRVGENTPAGATTLPSATGLACSNVYSGLATDCVPLGSTVPRAPDRPAKDGGQFGGAVRLQVPALNEMGLGFYGMNYHSRLPVVSGTSRSSAAILPNQTDSASYIVEYPENIHLYGTSFNTTLGAWSLQGEYSWKQGQPLQLDDVELLLAGLGAAGQISPVPGALLGGQYIKGYRRLDVSQYDLGVTRILSPNPEFFGYDQLLFLGEVALVHVNGMPSPEVLAFDAPSTDTANAGSAALNPTSVVNLPITPYGDYATPTSWGYNFLLRASYNNAFGPVSVEPTLRFVHDVNGTTPLPLANFVESRKQAIVDVALKYLDAWQVNLGYTNYFGAGRRNLLADRDFISASLRYQF